MIFQGQEFLESGYFSDSQPLDWTKQPTFSGFSYDVREMIRCASLVHQLRIGSASR